MAVRRPKLPVRPNTEPHIVIDGVVHRARPCGVLIDGSLSKGGAGLIGPDGTPFKPCGQVAPLTGFGKHNNVESAKALCAECWKVRIRLSKKSDDVIAAHADISKRYGHGNWTDERVQEHGALLGLTGGRLTGGRTPDRVCGGRLRRGIQLATFDPIIVDDVEIEFGSVRADNLANGKAHHEGWTVQKVTNLVKSCWPERNMRLTDSWFVISGRNHRHRHLQFTGILNINGVEIEMTRDAQMNAWKNHDPFKSGGYDKHMPGWFYVAVNNVTGSLIFGITNDLQQRWNSNYGKRDRTVLVAIRIEDGEIPQVIESGIKAATDAYHSPCSTPFDGEMIESICDTIHARLTLGTMIDEAQINYPDTSRVVFYPDLSPLDYRVDTGEPELEWADYNSDAWWEDDVAVVGSTNVALTA